MEKTELEIIQECVDGTKTLIEECKDKLKLYESLVTGFQAQIAEAEKPVKLENGDYGLNYGFPRIAINGRMYEIKKGNDDCESWSNERWTRREGWEYKGNLADELQALKPLEEFEMDVHTYGINRDKGWAHAPIHIAGNNHTLAELSAFILNLRCIEYKLKLDEAKK